MRSAQRSSLAELFTWVALLIALSPQLADLAGHLATNGWARYSLVFPLLFLRCALREETKQTPLRWGYLLLAIALVLSLLGALGTTETIRFTRYSIPLSVFGLALAQGRPSWKVATLALWAIPLPTFLLKLPSPHLEDFGSGLSCALFRAFSVDCSVSDAVLTSHGQQLILAPQDNGVILLMLLTGLAIYAHIVRGSQVRSLARSLIRAICLTLPLQWAAILLAAILASLSHAAAAQSLLSSGLWVSIAATVVFHTELKVRCGR